MFKYKIEYEDLLGVRKEDYVKASTDEAAELAFRNKHSQFSAILKIERVSK